MRWLGLVLGLAACGGGKDPSDTGDGSATDTVTHPPPDTGGTTVPTDTDTGTGGTTAGPERRYDCAGLDPADPAPLGGVVFLTFDDGPDPVDTPVVMSTLRAYDAPATFFVLGSQLSDPAVWPLAEEMEADPLFDIGNHSWTHVDFTTVSATVQAEEIDDTTDLIETFGPRPTFFRFPYGDSTCADHDFVTDRGYRVAGWHIDPADWCYASGGGVCTETDYWRVPPEYATDMIGWTMEQIRRFDGGVILFHDIHTFTADELAPLLDQLLDEGYTFGALDDAGLLPNLNAGTPADLPYLGERCDPTDDQCWQVEFRAWCEPTDPDDPSSTDGVCTLPCEGYCLDRDGAATTFCADLGGAGQCAGRQASQNDGCDALPGTVPATFDRFGSPPGQATICAPPHWLTAR
ncbi:MAG: polysaccharide deacetylase family protein [Myxococcota bacterium]